jgi:hypothetical protein
MDVLDEQLPPMALLEASSSRMRDRLASEAIDILYPP